MEWSVTEITLATLVKSGMGNLVHRNRANHGFALAVAGKKIYRFGDGTVLTATPDHIIYLPMGSDYTVTAVTNGDVYAVNFLIDKNETFAPALYTVGDVPAAITLYQEMKDTWLQGGVGYAYQLKSFLYSLLYALKIEANQQGGAYRRILPAMKYLGTAYTTPDLTVTELANLCDVSDTYFRQLFGAATGMNPQEYIIKKRMELAVRLLASGIHTVSETAALCGYRDLSVFSRCFRNYYGTSPSGYVRKL